MRQFIALLALGALASASSLEPRQASCTLAAAGAGKDDAPAFLAAVKSCSTTTIPAGTTLNISTKMDMRGLADRHIVCAVPSISVDISNVLG